MKDQQELLASHAAGFGGSDAAMVLAIAQRIESGKPLTTTQKHRVRVIKGMELPNSGPETASTIAGHAFEDEVASTLPQCWNREVRLQKYDQKLPFAVFCHADFFNGDLNAVKECKWSRKFNIDGLLKEHAAQLQWYYAVGGVSSVSLCFDTADEQGCVDVSIDGFAVEEIQRAIITIAENWENIDLNITERTDDELNKEGFYLWHNLEVAAKNAKVAAEHLEEAKARMSEYMKENGDITSVKGDTMKITRTSDTVSRTFDSKKFEKDHADLYAAYLKDTKRKGSLRVELKKEGGEQ